MEGELDVGGAAPDGWVDIPPQALRPTAKATMPKPQPETRNNFLGAKSRPTLMFLVALCKTLSICFANQGPIYSVPSPKYRLG